MSTPVLVLGGSGEGKTASLRNMNPTDTLLIQALPKPLPFEDNAGWKPVADGGNVIVTDKSADILHIMNHTKRKIIVMDDFQYVMSDEFMRRSDEKGYDKFTEIGRNAWNILMLASQLAPDVRVYILAHTDVSETGRVKMKTIGKMLDEKITVEGMFTIVLRTIVRDNDYLFSTHNSGQDPVKSPMGMFKEDLIDNDLAAVDKRIQSYYPAVFGAAKK